MPARRRVSGVVAAALMTALLVTATAAYAEWLRPERRLSTNAAIQLVVELNGDRLLYKDYRNSTQVGDPNDPTDLYDIRVLNIRTGTDKLITPGHRASGSAAMSGDNVVWEDYGTGTRKGGIYYYNLRTNTSRRLPISSGRELQISGDKVTYEALRNGWKVYVFDISENAERLITPSNASPSAPDISGTKVVWQDYRNAPGNADIYMYDLVTRKESRITTDAASQTLPKISGNRIVWIDERNGLLNWDIYMHDLATHKERRITTDPNNQWFPQISGSRIVWSDNRDGAYDNYLYDLSTGVETRVTSSTGAHGFPVINGSRIAYDSVRDGNTDLYLVQIAIPRLSIKAPPTVAYDTTARVTGRLSSYTDVAVAGKTVTLQYSKDKKSWVTGSSATTRSDGTYALNSPHLEHARYLRVVFRGDADYPAMTSASLLVKPRLHFTDAPRMSTYSVIAGRTYSVWGYFQPKHATGSRQIKLRAYRRTRQVDGSYKYVYTKTFTMTVSNPAGSAYSKYKGYVTLPYSGRWRIRAYHAEDATNAQSFSAYRYLGASWSK